MLKKCPWWLFSSTIILCQLRFYDSNHLPAPLSILFGGNLIRELYFHCVQQSCLPIMWSTYDGVVNKTGAFLGGN